jgi:hypothetical protein
MGERQIGIIINGATGRMGTTQHMANLLAIAKEGGLPLRNGDRLVPDLLLVGRDADRLKGDLHGLRGHRRPAGAGTEGDRSRQAHPYRETYGSNG